MTQDTKVENAVSFRINKEDHTLGNFLRSVAASMLLGYAALNSEAKRDWYGSPKSASCGPHGTVGILFQGQLQRFAGSM